MYSFKNLSALYLSLFALTFTLQARAEGGMTGGGGTSDEVCYFITPDNTLTLNDVSHQKLCAPSAEMIQICTALTGSSEDCTGIDAERLRLVLGNLK